MKLADEVTAKQAALLGVHHPYVVQAKRSLEDLASTELGSSGDSQSDAVLAERAELRRLKAARRAEESELQVCARAPLHPLRVTGSVVLYVRVQPSPFICVGGAPQPWI